MSIGAQNCTPNNTLFAQSLQKCLFQMAALRTDVGCTEERKG